MKIPVIIMFISLVMLQSCTPEKKTKAYEEVFWVSGIKTECSAGAGKAQCLNVYKGDILTNATWENFYAPIENFEFKKGTFQKIKVKVTPLEKENMPADASSLKYTLLEHLEQQPDIRVLLQGNWMLHKLNDAEVTKKAQLTINLNKKQLSGNDSCNNFTTTIQNLTAQQITLGAIASTRKMCKDMELATAFTNALGTIKTYQIKGSYLTFFNDEGKKILSFLKQNTSTVNTEIDNSWIAMRINENPINRMVKSPQLEINLKEMKLMGSDGCNQYTATIKNISDANITVGNIASTNKMCKNIDIANKYTKALGAVKKYKLKDGKLTFFDIENKEVLFFLKAKSR